MKKIGIISPGDSDEFQTMCKAIASRMQITPLFFTCDYNNVSCVAKRFLVAHPDICGFVARPITAFHLRQCIDLPVIDMNLGDFDVAKAIANYPDKTGKFIVIQFTIGPHYDIENISKICNVDLQTTFIDPEGPCDYNRVVEEAGCDKVVTSVSSIGSPCELAGKKVIMIKLTEEEIEDSFRRLSYIIEKQHEQAKRTEQLLQILNAFSEGFLAVDEDSNIVMFNKPLCDIARVVSSSVIGMSLDNARKRFPFIRALTNFKSEGILEYDSKSFLVSFPKFETDTFLQNIWCVTSITAIQKMNASYATELVRSGFRAKYHFDDIISVSTVMDKVKLKAKQYAATDCNILIYGESGTGKEMMAQSIHNASKYKNGPFVAISCAALPETLLESELFGYEEGAFTGARRNGKAGFFELSNHGTLFLDEIGLMPLSLQGKLLRSIQEKQVSRVGGTRMIHVENRIICATNDNLAKAVEDGSFRADLYYRLDVLSVELPPLRDRIGHIPFLAKMLLQSNSIRRDGTPITIDDSLLQYLSIYSWPGNFRQLDSFCERLLAVSTDSIIQGETLKDLIREIPQNLGEKTLPLPMSTPHDSSETDGKETYIVSGSLNEIEEQVIRESYQRYRGDISTMLQALGIGRTTLWRKLKRYGLSKE